MIPCACGCGELINERDNRNRPRKYKVGHMKGVGKGKTVSEETRKRMSQTRRELYQ